MKKYITISFFLLSMTWVFGIPTDSIFFKTPDRLLPAISRLQRYELSEYYKAGKKDSVQNLFGKNTILIMYDTVTCHVIIKTSAISSLEIKKIKTSTSEFLAVITTVNSPFGCSNIGFYSEDWQMLDKKIQLPNFTEWIDKQKLTENNIEPEWIKSLVDKGFCSMYFGNSNELIVKNNVLDTLSEEDKKLVLPYFINKTITLKI